ncbi:hypothetical protein VR7878_02515 [Vibrio ruber DSM 16370]|uniref:Uncharacterized protein n=1 Tax=Vibrio ruber (strain DSM 16370 / JCM 11486 / BCRC 17186 / CECT 7878 / LMG 23124 / VR1) TaxID=1123498 RepID=A0A1R4LNC2_VIBR1|nr:hypothetical protein [Vibrio ruber]SJN57847.1 hypothetical protein VR7878_02515 [Vibrio ruber DSM 16370]
MVISNEPIHCRQDFSWVRDNETSRQELLNFAEQAGGELPDWLKQDSTLQQQFLDILTADLKIAESISSEQIKPLDGIPMLVIYGEDDPLLSTPPSRWKECTTGQCYIESILGKHFITSTHGKEIYELIKQFAISTI